MGELCVDPAYDLDKPEQDYLALHLVLLAFYLLDDDLDESRSLAATAAVAVTAVQLEVHLACDQALQPAGQMKAAMDAQQFRLQDETLAHQL